MTFPLWSRILALGLGRRSRSRVGRCSGSRFYRPRVEALEDRTLLSFATTSPESVAVGDFTGHGKLDLAVANNSGTVSVFLGNGDGTFQDAQDYAVGSSPSSVAVGDFTGDGKLDLAVANAGSGTVSILLGNGDGTFQPAVSYSIGSFPDFIAVGDFGGNGKLDLAVANGVQAGGPSGTVSVLLGNGDGTFQPAVTYAVGISPEAVAVGDFTGDGKLDLAVASYFGTVSILLGNGDGTFQPEQSYNAGRIFERGSLAVGDFTGDGKPDLALFNYNSGDSTVNVLPGNGDGTFQPAVSSSLGKESFGSLAAGDFTGDGHLGLALANAGSSTVSILLGNGDGSFRAGQTYAVGGSPSSVAVGDFTGDGKLDLAVTNADSNSVSILLGNGDGTFQPAHNYLVASLPESVAVGDFTGNGHSDLAIADAGTNTVRVLLGNGDGTFQSAARYSVGSSPDYLAVGDFTGDGHLDLAVANRGSGTVSILLGNGDGTFQPAVSYAVGSNPDSVAVGDFTGDGHLDLAVANGGSFFSPSDNLPGTVSILLGNGDGTFGAGQEYAIGDSPTSVAVGDFNGDGKRDLAIVSYMGGPLSILLGNGDGTFQAARTYPAEVFPQSVAVGDFTGDGRLDLAVANGVDAVSIYLGNGDGTFQPAVNYPVGFSPGFVTVADLNRNGHLDLVVANQGSFATSGGNILQGASGTVSVLLGNGDGTFQAAQTYPVGSASTAVAVGEFTTSGFPDLAVATVGGITVLLGPFRPGGQIVANTIGLSVFGFTITQDFQSLSQFGFVNQSQPLTLSSSQTLLGSLQMVSGQAIPLPSALVNISSGSSTPQSSASSMPQSSAEARGAGANSGAVSAAATIELTLPSSPDIILQEMLPLSATNFAFGLETLLTGNQEQVAELLPQKESSLVPLATLIPGTRMDLSNQRSVDSGDPSTLNAFLVGFDQPPSNERQSASTPRESRRAASAPIDRQPQPQQQQNESPTLLDLLIPKPTDQEGEVRAVGKARPEPLPNGRTQSSSGLRNGTDELLEASAGIEPGELVQLSSALLAVAVLQALWSAPVPSGRSVPLRAPACRYPK